MTRIRPILLTIILAVPGCFPSDLDVSKKGELLIPRQEGFFLHDWRTGNTTRLPWKGDGLPVYARFVANESDVLLASLVKKEFVKELRLEIMPIQGGEPRLVFKTTKSVSSAALSPDGKKLVIVQHADLFQDYLPEIHVVDIASAKSTLLADKAGPFVHWLPDSKTLLTFKIEEKIKDTQQFSGHLGTMNVADAAFTPLAQIIGDKHSFLTVAPDLQRVLISAFAADGVDAQLDPKEATNRALFECHITNKTIRKITSLDRKVEFARFSPDGKQVLLVAEPKDTFITERRDLLVTDGDLQNPKTVAKNSHASLVRFSIEDANLPGWLDDKTICYFAKVNVYGTTGRALHLRFVNADGSNNRDVQPDLDLAVDAIANAGAKTK